MKKKIIKGLLLGSITALISGCTPTPPPPYQKTIDTSTLNNNEADALLKYAINKEHNRKRFHNQRNSFVSGNTLSYKGVNATFRHTFSLSDDSTLTRKDDSKAHHGDERGEDAYCMLCLDYGFSDYVGQFQDDLTGLFSSSVNEYKNLKANYKVESKNFQAKKKKIQFSLIDNTNTLPKNIQDKIKDGAKLFFVDKKLNVSDYIRNGKNEFITNNFYITAKFPTKVDRYIIRYKDTESLQKQKYNKIDNIIEAQVESVKYNFIPNRFLLKDKSLSVSVFPNSVSIDNKTNNFLRVESISIYYNGGSKTLSELDLELAPKTTTKRTLGTLEHIENTFVELKEKNQSVDYGLAISYYNQDTNKRTTLYKKEKYTTKLLK